MTYASVDDFEEYTGVFGAVTVGGTTLADVEYDVRWATSDVTYPRGSKYSDGVIPGKRTVTTTIKKVLVRSEIPKLLGYSLNDSELTGEAAAAHAGISVATDDFIAMTDPTPSSASVVKVTLITSAVTTAGYIVLNGVDANDQQISEVMTIPTTMAVDSYKKTSKAFKTLSGITVVGVRSTGTGLLKIDYLAGNSTYTFGNPKIFELVGTLTKGAHVLTITQPACWFKEGGINWVDAGQVVSVNLPVSMHDPDLLTLTST